MFWINGSGKRVETIPARFRFHLNFNWKRVVCCMYDTTEITSFLHFWNYLWNLWFLIFQRETRARSGIQNFYADFSASLCMFKRELCSLKEK